MWNLRVCSIASRLGQYHAAKNTEAQRVKGEEQRGQLGKSRGEFKGNCITKTEEQCRRTNSWRGVFCGVSIADIKIGCHWWKNDVLRDQAPCAPPSYADQGRFEAWPELPHARAPFMAGVNIARAMVRV